MLLTIAVIHQANAQFSKATLQASGLTCALCTKAVHNALAQLPFVATITPDIKNSAFNITFKEGASVNIDALKKAVEDAGFSVAQLKITGKFNNVAIRNDEHVTIGNNVFHFLLVSNQTLNGEKQLTVVDKDFVTAKTFKKYAASTGMSCIQTGHAEPCCSKSDGTRIYHVTI